MIKELIKLHKSHTNRPCPMITFPLYMELFPTSVVIYTEIEDGIIESISCISRKELPSDITEVIASFGEEETVIVWEEDGSTYLNLVKTISY